MDDDDDDDDACVAPTARYGTYTNRLMAIASRQRIVRDEEEALGEEELNHGDSDEPDYQEEAEDEAEEAWGEGEDGDEPDYQEEAEDEAEEAWGEGEFNHEDNDVG